MFEWAESWINQALFSDARTKDRLSLLIGKCLEIKIEHVPKTILVDFTEKGLVLSAQDKTISTQTEKSPSTNLEAESAHLHPAVTVEGPLQAFLVLATSKNPLKAAKWGLTFSGDLNTVQAVQKLFLSLSIDWEELLSHFTGDTVAHNMGRLLHFAQKKQKAMVQSFCQNTHLYLTEEMKILPTVIEVTEFINDVDKLRLAVDRLEAQTHLILQETKKGAD